MLPPDFPNHKHWEPFKSALDLQEAEDGMKEHKVQHEIQEDDDDEEEDDEDEEEEDDDDESTKGNKVFDMHWRYGITIRNTQAMSYCTFCLC